MGSLLEEVPAHTPLRRRGERTQRHNQAQKEQRRKHAGFEAVNTEFSALFKTPFVAEK